MKFLAIAIVVNLALSSSSTVVGVPHAIHLGFRGSLGRRSTNPQVRHSLLSGRLIETVPKDLFKRGNVINAQDDDHDKRDKYDYNEDDHDDDGDDNNDLDDNDRDDYDSCEGSSDSTYTGHRSTGNLHTSHNISFNSTRDKSPTSKLPLKNSSHSEVEHSFKPSDSVRSHQPSVPESVGKKNNVDSQKYDVSSGRYASDIENAVKRHGFVGAYNGYQGKATFFSQGGSAGACGKVHEDSDFVVAIQSQMYDGGKYCGKTVIVTRQSTGKSVKCIAADMCPGCPTDQSLDLSIAAFNALGNPDEGIFDIHWQVVD